MCGQCQPVDIRSFIQEELDHLNLTMQGSCKESRVAQSVHHINVHHSRSCQCLQVEEVTSTS